MKDLIVVGAGPAGSRLASESAKRGWDVEVLEKGEIGRPLACSGHLSGDIWQFLPDDAKSLKQNEIRGARFHVGDKSYRFYKDEPVSYALDRVEMDKTLARVAEENGAEITTGIEVRGVEELKSSVSIEARSRDGERKSYESRLVAGCDGPRSTVREELGIGDPQEIYQGILAFSDEDGSEDFVDVYLDVPDFFGWRIPRGESVEYGAASKRHVKDRFYEVVDPDAEIRDICAGQIPIGPPEKTVSERSFLVGDAGAQVKPFTGGGIIYGMTAADIAAEVIDPQDPKTLERYDTEWRNELGREIFLGKFIKKGYTSPSLLQRLGMSVFEGEINVHMDKPTTLFNRKTMKRVFKNVFSI